MSQSARTSAPPPPQLDRHAGLDQPGLAQQRVVLRDEAVLGVCRGGPGGKRRNQSFGNGARLGRSELRGLGDVGLNSHGHPSRAWYRTSIAHARPAFHCRNCTSILIWKFAAF